MNSETASEILAIARNLNGKCGNTDMLALAQRHIEQNSDLETFRAAAMTRLTQSPPVSSRSANLGCVNEREWRNYSLTRALLSNGTEGLEKEVSDEVARQTGVGARGFYIPDEVFNRNHIAGGVTVSANTVGGKLVGIEQGDFINILRNRSVVVEAGATQIDVQGVMVIPRQSAAGVPTWVSETQASALTNTGLDNITLAPQAVATQHRYSKQLLMQSNGQIDNIVRNDILSTLALEIDRAALNGSGSGEPYGISATTGINSINLAASGLVLTNTTALPFLCSLESSLASANVNRQDLTYILRGNHAVDLSRTVAFTSTATPIFEMGVNGDGNIRKIRALTTSQIPTNLTQGGSTLTSQIFLGDFSNFLIGNHGPLDCISDIFSGAGSGLVSIYGRRWVSFGVRHPQAFALGTGIL